MSILKTSLLILMLIPLIGTAADRVGDFSLLDQDGYHHSMSWYDDHQAIALLVQANGSDATAAAVMMGGCAKGNVRTETLRAFTEDEIQGVLDKIK